MVTGSETGELLPDPSTPVIAETINETCDPAVKLGKTAVCSLAEIVSVAWLPTSVTS